MLDEIGYSEPPVAVSTFRKFILKKLMNIREWIRRYIATHFN